MEKARLNRELHKNTLTKDSSRTLGKRETSRFNVSKERTLVRYDRQEEKRNEETYLSTKL